MTAAVAVCIVIAGGIGWWLGSASSRGQGQGQKDAILGRAPSYHGLINQLGNSVDSSQFKGKVQLVTFLFPYCTTYCPLIAAHLVGFENTLQTTELRNKVRIVAFNVAPGGTGPKQMRAFLKEYGWNPKNLHWQYLTGKPAAIRRVVTKGFHIAYRKVSNRQEQAAQANGPALAPQPTVYNPLAQKAHVDYDVTHNDGLIIVGPHGHVRKVYDQADLVSTQQLLRQVRQLLPNAGLAVDSNRAQ